MSDNSKVRIDGNDTETLSKLYLKTTERLNSIENLWKRNIIANTTEKLSRWSWIKTLLLRGEHLTETVINAEAEKYIEECGGIQRTSESITCGYQYQELVKFKKLLEYAMSNKLSIEVSSVDIDRIS